MTSAGVLSAGSSDVGAGSARISFTWGDDADPIPAPDTDAPPDPALYGLPSDFPLPPRPAESDTSAPAVQLHECEHGSGVFRVDLPDGWWTSTEYDHPELGELAECQFFAPEPFDSATATREDPTPEGVALTVTYLDGGCLGYINPTIESRAVTVDGLAGTAIELAQGKEETNPPGQYQYVVNLEPDVPCEAGQLIVARTGVDLAGDYEENKGVLDEMMRTVEITLP